MSMCYWMCEGIGIEQGVLLPFVDGMKLAKAIVDNNDFDADVTMDEIEEDYEFSRQDNQTQVELLMKDYLSDENDALPALLLSADEKNALVSCNDNDGQYFLLYPPRYPWINSDGFTSMEEVVEYLCDVLLKFCRDDVTREEIRAIIDTDVHAVGCG